MQRRLARFDLTAFEAEQCDPACARLATLLEDAWNTAQTLSDEVHERFFIHAVSHARFRGTA